MSQPTLRLVEGETMDKEKALGAALAQIERSFGKGSVMRLGKEGQVVEVETVSTGSIGLDIALGRSSNIESKTVSSHAIARKNTSRSGLHGSAAASPAQKRKP